MANLKDVLVNWDIPFTDLLPNKELEKPLAEAMWYKDEILNESYEEKKPVLDENWEPIFEEVEVPQFYKNGNPKMKNGEQIVIKENKQLFEVTLWRMEKNPETYGEYINRTLTDESWDSIRPIIKDIMLASQIEKLKKAEEDIDNELRNKQKIIRD